MLTRTLNIEDCQNLSNSFEEIGWHKPVSLFEQYYNEQHNKKRYCFVTLHNNKIAGYITLLFASNYRYFKENNIPEISDLNILPSFRKKGFGTALITKCEETAFGMQYKAIGLGAGLTADYTNAINLYQKLGYHFDGNGIAYSGKTLEYNQQTVVDDELNLYLIKKLKK